MICPRCNKREATIHYAEIVEGEMKKLDLCEICAEELGISGHSSLPLSDFLSGLMDGNDPKGEENNVCSCCKMTYATFKRTGRLGCSHCYDSFKEGLFYLIETIHKNKQHVGRVPKSVSAQFEEKSRIEGLEEKLKEAIIAENFEEAAKLRDKIRELKKDK